MLDLSKARAKRSASGRDGQLPSLTKPGLLGVRPPSPWNGGIGGLAEPPFFTIFVTSLHANLGGKIINVRKFVKSEL